MILRIVLLLVSLPLLAHGAEGLFHAFRSRTQAHVNCDELLREPPRSGWIHVTGCEVDYVRAAYRERGGRVTEMFFPLRPAGSSPAVPAALVLATSDPEVLAIADATLTEGPAPDSEAFIVMMLKIVTAMRAAREVDGLTRSNLEMLRTRRDFGAIKAPLADGFTVLDLHHRPRLLQPAVEVAIAATLLLLVAFLSTARRRAAHRALREAAATSSSAPDLRRLMLLNLPPHATADAIEKAPPLGSQASVRASIAQVLPGATLDDDGVGEFNRPDHSVRLDIGRDDPVHTAVVDITGDASRAALKKLVTQTAWRAYAPRLGRFITAEDLE